MNMTQDPMDSMHRNAKAAWNAWFIGESAQKEVEFFSTLSEASSEA